MNELERLEKIQEKTRALFENDFVIMDTETTGLDDEAEVCEIAIIDKAGDVLFDSLIKPGKPIPEQAINIHGITNEMVTTAPTFAYVYRRLENILNNHGVICVYNFDYDIRILKQCAELSNINLIVPPSGECIMKMYAEFLGQWDDYRKNYKWIKLIEAARRTNYVGNGKAHRALEDCFMTLHVMRHMATLSIDNIAPF